jgi:hypothetical protein
MDWLLCMKCRATKSISPKATIVPNTESTKRWRSKFQTTQSDNAAKTTRPKAELR